MGRLRPLYVLVLLFGLLAPQAALAGADQSEFSVRVTTPAFEVRADGLLVPGCVLNQQPGAPALPVCGRIVELPPTGDWTVQAVSRNGRSLPARMTIRPAVTPARGAPGVHGEGDLLQDGAVQISETPDPAIYGRNAVYPATVAVSGREQWQRGQRLLSIQVFPFQYNPVTREVVYHPEITVTVRVSHAPAAPVEPVAAEPAAPQQVTGETGALRLYTSQRGMHRLTYTDLANAGVTVATLNPNSFTITYLGQPVQIQVTGAGDGRFDPGDLVIFYAEPYVGRWMSSNVYRFSYGTDAAPANTRMTTRAVTPTGTEPVVTTGKQTAHIEVNKAYYGDFDISTEADHIFDNPITPSTSNPVIVWPYDVVLDDPIMAGDMSISAQLFGSKDQGPNPDIWAKMQINSHDVGEYSWNGRTPYTIAPVIAPMAWLDAASNKLNFVADLGKFTGLSTYAYYVNYADITYPARLDAEGDRIEIRDPDIDGSSARVNVTGFSTSAVRIYDVRDPRSPVQLLTTDNAPVSGATQIGFWDAWSSGAPKPAYSLTSDGALLAPTVEVDRPSALKSTGNAADYIVIVHRSLSDAVQPLLDRRVAQGLRVMKVDVQDVYDEFNYGQLHQNAIRDFLKYAYQNWNQGSIRPKYVVLVGDATTDYKRQLTNITLQNLVPAFLGNVDPFILETAADNRFVTFDGPSDLLPEMMVGRISAQNPAELTNYLDKVAAYEDKAATPDGDWQNRVMYVADDDNNSAGNFHALSDDVRLNWLPASYQSPTIYYNPDGNPPGGIADAAAMRTAIKKAFDDSAIFMQWFGHASRFRWGYSYSMWNIFDPPTLAANNKLPFVAAFSCYDGFFHNMEANYSALAEKHLLTAGRGSIGGLSPSGMHIGSALSVLDQGLTKSFFQDGKAILGEASDAAKLFYYANSTSYMDVLDTSILFGDPALRLRLLAPLGTVDSPYVYIQPNGATQVNLVWDHLGASFYEVYRSTVPYPTVGVAPTNRIDYIPAEAYGSGYVFVETDDGVDHYPADGTVGPVQVLGDPAVNYFWVVQSRDSAGASQPYVNIVGEFDFALVKGN